MNRNYLKINNESSNIVAVTFKLAGKTQGMIGIYGPCDDDPAFFSTEVTNVIKRLNSVRAKNIIIAGDMNVQLGKKIGYVSTTSRKKKALLELCDKYDISDHVALLAAKTSTSPVSFWRKNTLKIEEDPPAKRSKLVDLTTY